MAWKTLYVTGKEGFDTEFSSCLERSEINFLTGSFDADGTYLFWVTDDVTVAHIKKAIGSRMIFKYRMRFFSTVNAFLTSRDNGKKRNHFTAAQEAMFRELND